MEERCSSYMQVDFTKAFLSDKECEVGRDHFGPNQWDINSASLADVTAYFDECQLAEYMCFTCVSDSYRRQLFFLRRDDLLSISEMILIGQQRCFGRKPDSLGRWVTPKKNLTNDYRAERKISHCVRDRYNSKRWGRSRVWINGGVLGAPEGRVLLEFPERKAETCVTNITMSLRFFFYVLASRSS